MSNPTLGIIGGGQLGSLLAEAAKKLNIETVILSDDTNAPAKNFTSNFIYGSYGDEKIINEFISKVDLITFEFENIPYKVLKNINEHKTFLPKPEVNKLIQNRYYEKDFLNKNDIRTTRYALIKDEDDIKINQGNTSLIKHGTGTYARRSAAIAGSVAIKSTKKLKKQIIKIASYIFETTQNNIHINDGFIFQKDTNKKN